MQKTTMAKFAEAISKASKSELKELSAMIRERWDYLETIAKFKFQVGDDVEFQDKKGHVHTGKIVRLMKKNVRVKVGDLWWTVPPSLLRKTK